MAKLTKCKDCGAEVSKRAKTCPHCGVDKPGGGGSDSLYGCLVLLALIGAVYLYTIQDEPGEEAASAPPPPPKISDAECKKSIQCWGGKHRFLAEAVCKSYVEKLANYSHKWTDGMLEPKFSKLAWKDKKRGVVTYVGDRIQFQTGLGAWQNHVYSCDVDPSSEKVLDVRATPGQL